MTAVRTDLNWQDVPQFITGKERAVPELYTHLKEASTQRFACKAVGLTLLVGMAIFGIIAGIKTAQSINNRIAVAAVFSVITLVVVALFAKRIFNFVSAKAKISQDQNNPNHPLLTHYLVQGKVQIQAFQAANYHEFDRFSAEIDTRLFPIAS